MTSVPSGIVTQASAVLLDTCAAIWLANGTLNEAATAALTQAGLSKGIFVSPITAWEVGLLAAPLKGGAAVQFLPDPQTWFARLMALSPIKPATLTNEIAIASVSLPGVFHRDPADRLLVATARARGFAIVTRDRKILDYAAVGHVAAIAC